MNYRFCLIGTKDTTVRMAEFIVENLHPLDCIITIDDSHVNTENISGYSSVDAVAEKYGIEVFKVADYSMRDEATRSFFLNNQFELAICMGWQRLIPQYVLERFSAGVFGFHGSCAYLPFGRGRSPLNWSIIRGDERFVLNLFKYDQAVDSPNIFTNRMFQINPYDTIRTLQYKNLIGSFAMVRELWEAFLQGGIFIRKISKDFDSLYPKRTPQDGKIDFTCRTKEIYNLIRAVTRPFPGAFAYANMDEKRRVTLWKAVPFDGIMDFSEYGVGEVIEIFDQMPIVRTLDGSILLQEYESDKPLSRGDILS